MQLAARSSRACRGTASIWREGCRARKGSSARQLRGAGASPRWLCRVLTRESSPGGASARGGPNTYPAVAEAAPGKGRVGCSSALGAPFLLLLPSSISFGGGGGWKSRGGKPAFPHPSSGLGAPPSLRATPGAHHPSGAPASQLRRTSHEPVRRPGPHPGANPPPTTGVKGKSSLDLLRNRGVAGGVDAGCPYFSPP